MQYFVSYMFNTTDGNSGFGNRIVSMPAIKSAIHYEELTQFLEKSTSYATVIVLFFKELAQDDVPVVPDCGINPHQIKSFVPDMKFVMDADVLDIFGVKSTRPIVHGENYRLSIDAPRDYFAKPANHTLCYVYSHGCLRWVPNAACA